MKLLFDLFPVILFFLAYMAGKRAPDIATGLVSQLLAAVGAGAQLAPEQGIPLRGREGYGRRGR